MVAYKLSYFNIRGRAEVVRYVFAAADVVYTDIRVPFEEWPKIRPSTLFHQLPQLDVDGQIIAQSNTIARYLAKEFGLAGGNKWEEVESDMYSGTIEDLFVVAAEINVQKDPKVKAESLKTFVAEKGPDFLQGFEAGLSKNSSGYLVGNALTYADLALLSGIEFLEDTMQEDGKALIAKFPNLQKHRQKIAALPKIAAYISKRAKTVY